MHRGGENYRIVEDFEGTIEHEQTIESYVCSCWKGKRRMLDFSELIVRRLVRS